MTTQQVDFLLRNINEHNTDNTRDVTITNSLPLQGQQIISEQPEYQVPQEQFAQLLTTENKSPTVFKPNLLVFYNDSHKLKYPDVFSALDNFSNSAPGVTVDKINLRKYPELVQKHFSDPETCSLKPILKCSQPSGTFQTMTRLPASVKDIINFIDNAKDPVFSEDSNTLSPYLYNESLVPSSTASMSGISRPQLTMDIMSQGMLRIDPEPKQPEQQPQVVYRSLWEEIQYDYDVLTEIISGLFSSQRTEPKIITYHRMPNCQYCKRFDPTWESLVSGFGERYPNVIFESPPYNPNNNGYPTAYPTIVKSVNGNKSVEYPSNAPRTLEAISEWILS